MSNTRSYTKKYFLLLFISIISTILLLPFISHAGTHISFTDVTVSENFAEYILINATVENIGDTSIENAHYGIQVLSLSNKDVFVDMEHGSETLTLEPGSETTISVVYKRNEMLNGEHQAQLTVVDKNGFIIDSTYAGRISGEATEPMVEIVEKSCSLLKEDKMFVTCDVVNNTDEEKNIIKAVTTYTPHRLVTLTNELITDTMILPPQETLSVEFIVPSDLLKPFSAQLSLWGENEVLDYIFVDNAIAAPKSIETNTEQDDVYFEITESRFLIHAITSLVALTVLYAILVYRRKTKEKLEAIDNPRA